MKIIFVDIDGVFLPQRARFLPGQDFTTPRLIPEEERTTSGPTNDESLRWVPIERQLDPVAVSLLARLVDLSSARVVASTSWRYHPAAGKAAIEKAFREAGWDIGEAWHEDWATPPTIKSERYREVSLWLEDHPGVERWIAFEDTHTIPPPGCVHVETDDGLLMRDYRKALLLLNVLDRSLGPGGGWPSWTHRGERDAVQQWLDHAYDTTDRVERAQMRIEEEWRERAHALDGEAWRKMHDAYSQALSDSRHQADPHANQRAAEILETPDPWTAEGGPAPFLKNPESVRHWIPEVRKARERLSGFGGIFV